MPNKRKVSVADSETDPFKIGRVPKPFIWGYYDGENYEEFASTEAFVEFAQERDEICYMHNGGKFDFFFMADHIEEFEPLTIIHGRIVKFKIGQCEFRDSYAILPVPLGAHDKGEMDYGIMEAGERDKPANKKKISAYLYQDCHSLYTFVMRYIDAFGINLTLASGAMKMWAAMNGIKPPNSGEAHYDTFAPFYYGGRVECFVKGMIERPFIVADIISAYPTAMQAEHAYGTLYDESEELPTNEKDLQRAFIQLSAQSLGAFPYRDEHGALTFPNDGKLREFNITGWEFLAARATGALSDYTINNVFTFYDSIEFNSYTDRFFAEKSAAKEAGDKAGYLIAKLQLTSLYGKFGANPSEYQEFKTFHPRYISAAHEAHGYEFCEMFGPNAVMARPISQARMRYFNVATAASITGYNRAFLWKSICQCTGVLYVDTDSIAATNIDGLKIGNKLGDWEIEAYCDRGAIAGKKLYAFHHSTGIWPSSGDMNFGQWKGAIAKRGWKVSSKGVRLDEKDICRIAQGETIRHAKDVPTFSIKSGVHFIARNVKMN